MSCGGVCLGQTTAVTTVGVQKYSSKRVEKARFDEKYQMNVNGRERKGWCRRKEGEEV